MTAVSWPSSFQYLLIQVHPLLDAVALRLIAYLHPNLRVMKFAMAWNDFLRPSWTKAMSGAKPPGDFLFIRRTKFFKSLVLRASFLSVS